MKGSLWVHFIDNTGAQAALITGSCSVQCGDVIVGHTASLPAALKVRPWYDRVASESNPVDGLSRGIISGQLRPIALPASLIADLRNMLDCAIDWWVRLCVRIDGFVSSWKLIGSRELYP